LSEGRRDGSGEESETAQVVLGPVGLILNHALERLEGERIARMMKRHRHAPAIGVTVALVAPPLGAEREAVVNKRAYDLAGGQTAQLAVLDRDRSKRDGYQRLFRNLDVLRNRLTVLE
jgi:hypothetical protein